MWNRQKIFLGLTISAGVCTGIALFIYLRHRRRTPLSKTPHISDRYFALAKIFSSIKSYYSSQYADIISLPSSFVNDNSQSIRFQSDGATIETEIPDSCLPLTSVQASVLTRFLAENNTESERLHRVLTTIANSAACEESQVSLSNAGCIDRLREILSTTNNETTITKILLALNNLALNDYSITHFSGLVSMIIKLCRTTPSNSLIRLYGLNLLINMSVLEYLHDEYMKNIDEFGLLIQSTFQENDELLSIGKTLVNLSTNESNIEALLKITNIELQTIVNRCTLRKKSIDDDEESSKFEDILLRYLTFYCNLAEIIINQLKKENKYSSNNNRMFLNNSSIYQKDAVYFELFAHDKQMLAKSIFRRQYLSHPIHIQLKRLVQAMDTIRETQFESSNLSIQDEFDQDDHITTTTNDFSTPKKISATTTIMDDSHIENVSNDLEKEISEQVDDDSTILANLSTQSDQSLSSFYSTYSTNENNTCISLDRSISN